MAPPSTEQQAQFDAALRHLEKAAQTAQAYLSSADQVSEVMLIHINFVTQRILGVEKVVSSINRRNKNEELLLPDAAEEASDLVRDMQIRRVELLRSERDCEKQQAATIQAQLAASLPAPTTPLLVVKKPPLPPLPIPRFSGDAMLYHNFVTVFNETIDKNDTLAPSQKLIYLQSYVDGEAKKLIGNILVTDANYDVARRVLSTNFGHTSQNITVLYDQLHDIVKARNDPFSIRDTFNEVENILQMLEHAGVNVNDDQYLRHEVMKKWPWPLVRQLVRSTDITLQEFREELSKEVVLQIHLTQATGYVQPQQRPKPYTERPQRSKNFIAGGGSAPTSGVAPTNYSRQTHSAPTSGVAQPPCASTSTSTKHRTEPSKTSDPVQSTEAVAMPKRSASCTFCREQHYAEECERYKTVEQRLQRLEGKCKKCFRAIHDGIPCLRNMQCRYCPSWDHNRAICPTKYGDSDPKYLFMENKQRREEDAAGLFMTLLLKVSNPANGEETGMRVLVDPACNRTAMTEQAARKIGISCTNKRKRAAKGMGERQVEPVTEESVKIKLAVRNEDPVEIAVRLTAKIANDVPTYDVAHFRDQYPHCASYYIPPTGAGCPVDIIIGSDKLLRFLTLQNCIYVHQTCQLLSTKFGWLIMAERADTNDQADQTLLTFLTKDEEIIKTMYDLDLVGMKGLEEAESEYEERALKIFYNSIKYTNGRYEVHWPWRHYPPNLNENYGLALGRLKNLLKKLKEQPTLLSAYQQIIEEQLNDDIVEDVPKNDRSGVIHYIPHHAVVVLEKSTPVRVVYDGSATCGKNRSLNSSILKGTKWLGNTVGSLVRFRRFGQAVTADIKRAFHQIAIAPMDRNAVRFIWVHDVTKPAEGNNIRILRFKRVAFGIVASPFLLYATIQFHLRNNATKYTDILCREMYADNLLASLPNEIDVLDFYKTSKTLFNGMSMNLTKWKTNVHQLVKLIPPEDQLTENEITVLGLNWSPERDEMGLRNPKINHLEKAIPTKRIVLKTMAAIFDPLGWAAPFVLSVRLFLRKLWMAKMSWETPLQPKDLETWLYLKKEMLLLHTVRLRRLYFTVECTETDEYELHTFVDASTEAVGNVTYLRLSSTHPEMALVMAKCRLSPAAKLTVPRLEFYALVLGVRTQSYVAEQLNLKNVTRYMWSDSKCVLAWVSSNKLLPVAIERHLKEIRTASISQFRYIPTALNPADIASRGSSISDLQLTNWFTGPSWLLSTADWPTHIEPAGEITEMEQTEPKALFIQGQNSREFPPPFFLKPTDFSRWKQLLRRTAYCIYLLHYRLKKKFLPVQTPIDYTTARMLWIRWDQRCNGSSELAVLQSIKHFKDVQLFTDDRGVLRCRSRLNQAKLPWDAVEPIILVKGSYLTELIILDIHERNFHVGTTQTLATLRKHYWLVHGRREIYRILHTKCYKCKTYNAKPYKPPEIAPLPEFRITQSSRPFENTGIDIFGPIYIYSLASQYKDKVKRWVLLFTCLVVRAIHFEILEAMDTQEILNAIKRFSARRGSPALILSDNAPQFHLIRSVTRELWQDFSNDEDSNRYFAENAITWKFTPQSAPWMGGAYERLVQVTKNAFRRTYGEQTITEREFNTTIIEIEGVINNRPITYVDRDLATPLLTPNKFLNVSYPALPITIDERENRQLSTKSRLIEYWQAAEKHLNMYWRIWSEQYLLALREIKSRTEKNKQHTPKVGDIVLMVDPTQRRGYWRKAIIERLIKSSDGKARSAQLRLPSGTKMVRPVVKLASLDLLDVADPELSASSSVLASGEGVEPATDQGDDDQATASVIVAPASSSC